MTNREGANGGRSRSTATDAVAALEPDCENAKVQSLDADLLARAKMAGLSWAELWFKRIGGEQREVVGGWPGTMSEARAQVVQTLVPWLRAQGKWPTTELTNFEATAHVLYRTAKNAWLERVVRPPSEGSSGGGE